MNKSITLTPKELALALIVLVIAVLAISFLLAKAAVKRDTSELKAILGTIHKNTETSLLAVGTMLEEQTQDVEHVEIQQRKTIGFKQQNADN